MTEVPDDLPGADLVAAGIRDLGQERETVEATLVATARPRLLAAGIAVPAGGPPRPWHRLYDLLADEDPGGAHGRYTALLRRMASFASAADHARAR